MTQIRHTASIFSGMELLLPTKIIAPNPGQICAIPLRKRARPLLRLGCVL